MCQFLFTYDIPLCVNNMNELNQDVSIYISLLGKESICQIEKHISALN